MLPFHQQCAIVLLRTKYAGNLGATVRAMANFGVSDLRLVNPEADLNSSEARALASHGEHLLQQARLFPSLSDAVADCVWVAGTSARLGGLFRQVNVLPSRDGMKIAAQQAASGKIALVFGPEDRGLLNEEVTKCHRLIYITAHPDYNVLNLAQAVAICLYEWFQATHDKPAVEKQEGVVTFKDTDRTLNHLEQALREIHFIWGEKADFVAHAIRSLLIRSQPDEMEIKLLHGMARQILWYVNHHPPGGL